MKKLISVILMSFLFSTSSMAFDGLELGVSLMGSKSDSTGEYEVDGVIIADYLGLEVELNDNLSLSLVPTAAEIALGDGKKVQVYTDMATLNYYGENDFHAMISAVNIDYKDFNNFTIQEDGNVALADLRAVKYFSLGAIELDISGSLSLGGITRSEDLIEGVNTEISGKHYYTGEVMGGIQMPITDSIDIYLYSGGYYRDAEKFEETGFFGGVNIPFKEFRGIDASIYFEYDNVDRNYVLEGTGAEANKDSMARMGLRITF